MVDWEIAKSRLFVVQLLSTFLQSGAYYVPMFFFPAYACTIGYTTTQGALFIAVSNATNAVGKLAIGTIADRYGRWKTLLIVTLMSGVVTLGL